MTAPTAPEGEHPVIDDVHSSFAAEVVVIARRWKARMDERSEALDLTLSRFAVLYGLSGFPEGLRQRELADRVSVEGATLVRLIDALVERGLVERRASTVDRRANVITLTEAAAPLVARFRDLERESEAELLSGIDEAKLRTCVEVLAVVRQRLEV
jgi:MarR family transcriptional regulator for hemolysin